MKKEIYLVGNEEEKIEGRQLPTNRQVLSVFFYKYKTLNLSIRQSLSDTVKEVRIFWQQARVPVRAIQHIINQLEKLHCEWIKIRKNRGREKSPAQINKEKVFVSKLNNLFDIVHEKALKTLKNEDCRQDCRLLSFIGHNSESAETVNDDENNRQNSVLENNDGTTAPENSPILDDGPDEDPAVFFQAIDKNNNEMNHEHDLVELVERMESMTSESSDDALSGYELERRISDYAETLLQPPPKRTKVMTPILVSTLDRTLTTDQDAAYIIAATAISLGHNLNDIVLSASTIRRARCGYRAKFTKDLMNRFQAATNLVVHFDGKILRDLVGREMVDRLPVVISGLETSHLLGVPKLENGTGAQQAEAVFTILKDWKLLDRVRALCFDTTVVNTGRYNGSAVLLEKRLQRNLLYLPCRHHIEELLLKSMFEIYPGETTGPNVAIFSKFQKDWSKIDKLQFNVGINDATVAKMLEGHVIEISNFIKHQFEVHQPRGDYQEFLELAYIFLGGTPPRGIHFKIPGAMHHARFLSKAIYSLKIFLFRDQLQLSAEENNAFCRVCSFIVRFYIKAWFTAPSAIQAPNNDLTLIQDLICYEKLDKQVSERARSKLLNHLWYCSEELVALALFDNSVTNEVKVKMVEAMHKCSSVTNYSKRFIIPEEKMKSLLVKDLSDFASQKSLMLFRQFDVSHDFLNLDPTQWEDDANFQNAKKFFGDLKVVNDMAERGVALMEEFNQRLTQSEEQMQYVLQVVQNHRKKYPSCNKKLLSTMGLFNDKSDESM